MTAAQRSTADRMIEAKGQAVTLTRRVSGAYNPATGTATITTSTQAGKGVILPLSAGLRHMAGSNVTQADRQCLLSGLKSDGSAMTPPQVDDTITDSNGVVWAVTEVSPLAPAGLSILYDLTVRGTA